MKHTLCTLALLLLFVASAHAQASSGVLKGFVTDQTGIQLEESTQTLYTKENVAFTVDVKIADSLFTLTNAQVEVDERGKSVKVKMSLPITFSTSPLACPEGFAAAFVADESKQYQMGYCYHVELSGQRRHTSALVHVNGTFGRGTVGVDLNKPFELPFWFNFPEQ